MRRAQPSHATPEHAAKRRRADWLRRMHQWHWISSAICLVGMILFSFTGITLNHAASIEAAPQRTTRSLQLDASAQAALAQGPQDGHAALPPAVAAALADGFSIRPRGLAEWSADEVYLSLPRPGGDGWLAIDRGAGTVEYEHTDRGWIAWLNDLHKGRNTGDAWRWFIDVFAVASLVFCLTGLVLLQLHGRHRPSTWPLVGAGVVIPMLLIVLLVH